MENYSYTEYEKLIIQTLNKFDLNYLLNNYKLSLDFCKNLEIIYNYLIDNLNQI